MVPVMTLWKSSSGTEGLQKAEGTSIFDLLKFDLKKRRCCLLSGRMKLLDFTCSSSVTSFSKCGANGIFSDILI